MDSAGALASLVNPPVLFFFAGMLATALRSDLEIPQPLAKFLSLYLLLAIGFKGGVELAHSGLTAEVARTLLAAIGMAVVTPIAAFVLLRRRFGGANAAGIAATYGSVSAVTFIAATALLDAVGIAFSGYMVAALALMESPAIIVAVALFRLARPGAGLASHAFSRLAHEALLNGSVFLLVVSVLIGMLSGEAAVAAMEPFTNGLFTGILCLFLLDMGLLSARHLKDLKGLGAWPLAFAVFMPLTCAAAAIALSMLMELGRGDAFLFCVLCASASYIAAPAALRQAIPEANPGLYLTMALALTFPFNLVVGMPLYLAAINMLWNAG